MHECLLKLLSREDDDSTELLCHLITYVGKDLDTNKKVVRHFHEFVNVSLFFGSIQLCLNMLLGKQPSIPLINLGRKWTLS